MPGDNITEKFQFATVPSLLVEAMHQGLPFPMKYRTSLTGHT